MRPLIGNRIYGCDDCLAVCPWNKFAQAGREAKLAARDALRAPPLAELARLDDAGFRALFTKSAVKRIGRARFVRNVLIAIGNSGDAALTGAAEGLLDDPSPLVRGAAIWALGRLDRGRLERCAIARRARTETETEVLNEWNGALREARMSRLICFGLGYSAEHFIARYGDGFERIVGTVRGAERAAVLNARFAGRLKALAFDGTVATPEVSERDRRSRYRARFDTADCEGRSCARDLRRRIGAREPSAVGRLSVHNWSLRQP